MTTCADHTVCPEGYLSWHAWAEKKARRHYQVRCDECGLWAIWRRKCRHAIYHHGCPWGQCCPKPWPPCCEPSWWCERCVEEIDDCSCGTRQRPVKS